MYDEFESVIVPVLCWLCFAAGIFIVTVSSDAVINKLAQYMAH